METVLGTVASVAPLVAEDSDETPTDRGAGADDLDEWPPTRRTRARTRRWRLTHEPHDRPR